MHSTSNCKGTTRATQLCACCMELSLRTGSVHALIIVCQKTHRAGRGCMHLMNICSRHLTHAVVTAVDEGLKRIKKAMAKRRTAEHKLNTRSSRSHLIMTFTLKTSAAVPDATFALVDLAGALSPSLSSECACSKHCTVSVASLDCRKCQPACMCEDWMAI